MGTIQLDAAEIRGRSHTDSDLERTIQSSSRHFASSADFGHRRAAQARFLHGSVNPTHHCSSALVLTPCYVPMLMRVGWCVDRTWGGRSEAESGPSSAANSAGVWYPIPLCIRS